MGVAGLAVPARVQVGAGEAGGEVEGNTERLQTCGRLVGGSGPLADRPRAEPTQLGRGEPARHRTGAACGWSGQGTGRRTHGRMCTCVSDAARARAPHTPGAAGWGAYHTPQRVGSGSYSIGLGHVTPTRHSARPHAQGWSDSEVSRGLVALLVRGLSGCTPEEVMQVCVRAQRAQEGRKQE